MGIYLNVYKGSDLIERHVLSGNDGKSRDLALDMKSKAESKGLSVEVYDESDPDFKNKRNAQIVRQDSADTVEWKKFSNVPDWGKFLAKKLGIES